MAAIEKISEEELWFMQTWMHPVALAESMFSSLDNLTVFNEQYSNIRIYQVPFLSFDSFIDSNVPGLNAKERFKLRQGASEAYNYSGRRIGKSLVNVKVDSLLRMLYNDNEQMGITSADLNHVQNVMDAVVDAVSYHPIVKMWKKRSKGAPKYIIVAKNGFTLCSVNMNVTAAKKAGQHFYGFHFHTLLVEEASMETETVYEKRKDAVSELGCIVRSSGMANITKMTPSGKAYYDPNNRHKIIALPQYVNELFTEEELQQRIKEYNGESSFGFKMFVEAEVCEDGLSEFDISRINPFINDNKDIKQFEIKKEDFYYYRNKIVVLRPKNAERIFICADVGDGAGGTKIGIFSEVNNKYYYLYKISLYNLKDDEQFEIFDWLIGKLQANVVALDCGDALGRSLLRKLEHHYPKDNLVRYAGIDKVGVAFKKDSNGNCVVEAGKPVFIEEFMSEWSVQWLKTLLYEGRILMPTDYEFITQINSVISHRSGTRMIYDCVNIVNGRKEDHCFDMFKIFAIAQWLKKDFNQTPPMQNTPSLGSCSWVKTRREIKQELKDVIKNKQKIECTLTDWKQTKEYIINYMIKCDAAGDK